MYLPTPLAVLGALALLPALPSVLAIPPPNHIPHIRDTPRDIKFPFDLNQKHVRVSRIAVSSQFVTTIQNMVLAQVQAENPGVAVSLVNSNPPGPADAAITISHTYTDVTAGDEQKSSSGGRRKQKNHAVGFAYFTVRTAASGEKHFPPPPSYNDLAHDFERRYNSVMGGGSAAWPVPCQLIPGRRCPPPPVGPWGPSVDF